jgi:hypothetical protein
VNTLSKTLAPAPFPEHLVLGMESQMAKDFLRRGGDESTLFYFDFEQYAAGLDKTYGLLDFYVVGEEELTFAADVVGKPGALLMVISKMDLDAMTATVLVEQL